MKKFAFFLFMTLLLSCFSQDVKQGLIVIHPDPSSGTEYKQKIFVYHFLNGTYTGRDELLTVAGKKDGHDHVRTDIGTPVLYKDRYFITGIGNVIDLKEKKVLFDGRATFIRSSNDSIVLYTNDIFKGKFYSVCDVKTNQCAEVKSLTFKPKVGQDIEFDKTVSPFKLVLYPLNRPRVEIVKDAGYGQKTDSRTPDPLFWWINNNSLVYGYFNKENTDLSFFRVDIDTKKSTLIGNVAIKPENDLPLVLKLSDAEAVVFFGSKQLLVNVETMSVTDQVFSKPSNGFSYECKKSSAGRTIKLGDAEVGKYHFEPGNFKTAEKIAALVKEIRMGDESYQQGLAVWNNIKSKWASVDAEEVLMLVGWIKE